MIRPDARLAGAIAAALAGALALPATLAAQSTVTGVVRDSLRGRALAGATVQLVLQESSMGTARSVETDSTGAFRIESVPAGRYLIGFLHPRLDSLGFEEPTRVLDVPAGTGVVRANLAIPGARTIVAALCGARRDSTGLLLGSVIDADRDARVAAGSVVITWGELTIDATGVHRAVRSIRAPVSPEGRYLACGVPTDAPVSIKATAGDDRHPVAESGAIDVSLTAAVPFLQRDLLVTAVVAAAPTAGASTPGASTPGVATPDTAVRRGSARLVGHVRRPDGTPFVGARVVVRGARAADSVAVSDASGAYRLDALPAGTYAVDAIGIGFTPAHGAADLRPGVTATVDLALGKRAAELARVSVYARYRRSDTEFAQRMRQGWGRFVTAADIERRAAISVVDALYTVPGLRVASAQTGRSVILGRGGCVPTVYLDGMRLADGASDIDSFVSPSEVGGIEVYLDAAQAPPQYAHNGCGSVLVWTKGGMR